MTVKMLIEHGAHYRADYFYSSKAVCGECHAEINYRFVDNNYKPESSESPIFEHAIWCCPSCDKETHSLTSRDVNFSIKMRDGSEKFIKDMYGTIEFFEIPKQEAKG